MGCDIHAYIDYDEFRKQDGTWWVSTFASLDISRNYDLFYVLAGVRYIPERMLPDLGMKRKGLPDRMGCRTKDAAKEDEGDGHSYSWLTVSELEEAQKRYVSMKEEPHQELQAIIECMKVLNGDELERSRLVFWFDN